MSAIENTKSKRRSSSAAFAALVLLVATCGAYVLAATVLKSHGAAVGFDFLFFRSGFQVSDSVFSVYANDPVWLSLLAGLANTIRVSVMGMALAIPIGVTLGVMRSAPGTPASAFAGLIIEPIRNTPVLLQLILWYGIVTEALPGPRDALSPFAGVYLSNRGLSIPWIGPEGGLQIPHLAGFNFEGGLTISPELTVLWFGLALFHGCYIAEIFRGGFQSIPRGQIDATHALALPPKVAFLRIILPQALAFAIPPTASQLLALVKNSTLAVAIGFADFVSVLGTAVNQNGRALEGVMITIFVFFTLNAILGALIEKLNRSLGATGRVGLISERREQERRTWREQFSESPWQIVAGAGAVALCIWAAVRMGNWAVLNATWSGGAEGCRAVSGACWNVIAEKYRLVLLGSFPLTEIWRAFLAALIPIGVVSAIGLTRFRYPMASVSALLGSFLIWIWLMSGGFGLVPVASSSWGGLPLTIGLAVGALVTASLLSLPLALARNSSNDIVASSAWAVVEVFRSTPLISLLLAADLLIPLLLPPTWQIDKVWRAYWAITLLTTAYLAEVLRGTFQAIPAGQRDAAFALGLNRRLAFWLVVLPQVCRIGMPAFANVFVGAIKDTSLVIVIGLLDITGAARAAVAEPQWRAHGPEIYMLVAAVYFALCFPIARFVARQDAGTIARRRSMNADISASSL